MKSLTRLLVAGTGAVALGAGVLGIAPALAQTLPDSTGSFNCTYITDSATDTVSGNCTGAAGLEGSTASFSGPLSPTGSASGSFQLNSPEGSSFGGSFTGGAFTGGTASGNWTVNTPAGPNTGTFTATQG